MSFILMMDIYITMTPSLTTPDKKCGGCMSQEFSSQLLFIAYVLNVQFQLMYCTLWL